MKLDTCVAVPTHHAVRAGARRLVKTTPFFAVFSGIFALSGCLRQDIDPLDVTGNKTFSMLEAINTDDEVVTLRLLGGVSVVTVFRHDGGANLRWCHDVTFDVRASRETVRSLRWARRKFLVNVDNCKKSFDKAQ
jgi:hypothetical protein